MSIETIFGAEVGKDDKMDVNTADPYEQKLYNMFKSFDIHSMDSLDKHSLTELCKMLELKDRGPKLVANLIDRKRNNRVTFAVFKEGLLNLLGNDVDEENHIDHPINGKMSVNDSITTQSADEFFNDAKNTALANTSNNNNNNNINDSKSREVSPKLIVRGKKYGRRSRPQSAAMVESSQSDSDGDYDLGKVPILGEKSKHHHQGVQRSVSQSDMHASNARCIRTSNINAPMASNNNGTKLKRCASLPAQRRSVPYVNSKDIKNLKTQLENSVESLDNFDFEHLSNSLFHEWNHFPNNAITDDTKTSHSIQASQQRNRIELERIFARVGLQTMVACKLADEVYSRLSLSAEQTISFDDFISLLQCNSERQNEQQLQRPWQSQTLIRQSFSDDDEYTTSPSNDLHASHSDEPIDWSRESMPVDTVIDMWELAHIKNASSLLDDLGFTGKEINLSQLLAVIDEELQNVHNDKEFTPLLRAALALHKAQVTALQKSLRHAAHENKQLHTNIHELNRRSFMLAQEIDERHANLETSAREELRQLEHRHAELVRELTVQLSNERENWSTLNGKLEKQIKQLELDDSKHRSDILRLQSENSALDKEQLTLQTQITDLLENNIQLNNEIANFQDRQCTDDISATEQTLELIDKISKLQIENANLRDKNDELATDVEEMQIELNKMKNKKQLRFDNSEDNASSGGEGSNMSSSSATKRRGDSPSKAKLSEESPRFGKLRKYHNDNSEGESEASGDWLALNSELNQSQTTCTTSGFSQDFSSLNDQKDNEIKELKAQISKLENELKTLQLQTNLSVNGVDGNDTGKTPNESKPIENVQNEKSHLQRIQELEASLEQMQKEYEACEDYWQGKLNEERQLYEEEQRISDEKFTELLKKMAEYEEQFSSSTERDGRLTPIEEKCQLEQQYADLEIETEEFRAHARKIFEEKTQEIEQLQSRIKELEERLSISSTIEQPNVNQFIKTSDAESVASSPISYLWNQSTIHVPTRDYQNPKWSQTTMNDDKNTEAAEVPDANQTNVNQNTIAPIRPPQSSSISEATSTLKDTGADYSSIIIDNTTEILDDLSSVRSFETHSVASTHSIHRSLPEIISTSPNLIREDIKRLKLIELQLNDEVKGLAHQRDGLVMELQQLHEAKPVLERAYARTPHPSLIQRIQQLEQKNRHLQFCLKQQQQYTESIMQQAWHQQRSEIHELRNTIETQVVIINEQAQRLTNSDVLVKDLYVENSQLTAAVQRLEQQRSRHLLQHPGIGSVPGML